MYNAVGLTKIKAITPAQLMQYASTGQFNAAAKRNLQLVTDAKSGITSVFDMDQGVVVNQVRTGQGTAGEGDTDLDIFEAQRTLIENSFEYQDRDGNVDEGRVQQALEQIETASDILGLTDEQRQDRSLLTSLKQGQRFVRNFKPDSSQTFDFNPFSDPELGPNNMALGFLADQLGVSSQEQADRFLYDYGITFRNAFPRMSAEDLLRNVQHMEQLARLDSDRRTEIVEATIAKAKGK